MMRNTLNIKLTDVSQSEMKKESLLAASDYRKSLLAVVRAKKMNLHL